MNKIHFVIKRHANILKYLELKVFLEEIAPPGNTLYPLKSSPPSRFTFVLQSLHSKRKY